MAKDYIPRGTEPFHIFQLNLVKQAVLNAASWNIPSGEATKIQNASSAYEVFYQKHMDKTFRTKVDVKNHLVCRVKYEKQIRQFVNAYMVGNPAIELHVKHALGLKTRGKKRKSRSRITDVVTLFIEPLTGGRIRITGRIIEAEGRPRLAYDSDGIEFRYAIGTKPEHPESPGIIRHFSPVTRTIFDLGVPNIGKYIYVFARWRNLRHEEKSGPWTSRWQMMIA